MHAAHVGSQRVDHSQLPASYPRRGEHAPVAKWPRLMDDATVDQVGSEWPKALTP